MKSNYLKSGTRVQIRNFQEIVSTLDDRGMLDGMPFMPEMMKFCGKTFHVHKYIQYLCIDEQAARILKDAVFLDDLRCDGSFHDGCAKACAIIWKSAWLSKLNTQSAIQVCDQDNNALLRDRLIAKERNRYVCQSAELINATNESTKFKKALLFFREIVYRNQTLPEFFSNIFTYLNKRFRMSTGSTDSSSITDAGVGTPTENLQLKAGDWVRIKNETEIAKTLDRRNRNRGLFFSPEMYSYCGKEFQVLQRVDKMIVEGSGRMIELKNTVMLQDVKCTGRHKFGCPRNMYHFWREVWLERI